MDAGETEASNEKREKDVSIQQRNIAHIQALQERKKNIELEKKQKLEEKAEKLKALKDRIVKECSEINNKQKGAKDSEPELGRPAVGLSKTGFDSQTENKKKGFLLKKSNKDSKPEPSVLAQADQDRSRSRLKAGIRSKTTTNIRDLRQVYGLAPFADKKPLKRRLELPPTDLPKETDNYNCTPKNQITLPHTRLPTKLKLEPISNKDMSPNINSIGRHERSPLPILNNSIVKKNIESLVSQKPRSFQYINNVDEWLKKNRLDPSSKVFIVSQGYPEIKRALEERGWIENPDYESSCFHFKFTLRSKDIDYSSLNENQIVNHFGKATTITTKSGLCKSIKNAVWACSEDPDTFFPKCFESFEEDEYSAFVAYYKLLRAESILKKVVSLGSQNNRGEEYQKLVQYQVPIAIKVAERRLMHIDDFIDKDGWEELSELDWEVLKSGEKTSEDLQELIKQQNAKRYEKMLKKKKKKKKKTKKAGSEGGEKEAAENPEPQEDDPEEKEEVRPEVEVKIIGLLNRLQEKYPQTVMNGSDNIWIVKPAGLSRGRGIKLFNSLAEINMQVRSKDLGWVIQKYIENPLLYHNRKLDIRQWVMVTDWNPLTIWFYKECYVRLSSSEYDCSNLKNRFSHLTNNSVNKYAKGFEKESGFLSQEEFAEHLKLLGFEQDDPFFEKIQPQMKKIVTNSLLCVQDMVENRKNSSEIYGYDFCVDDQLNTWLIEINSSPAWDYSSVVSSQPERHRETHQTRQRRLHQSHGRLRHGSQEEEERHRHWSLRKHLLFQGTCLLSRSSLRKEKSRSLWISRSKALSFRHKASSEGSICSETESFARARVKWRQRCSWWSVCNKAN